VRLRSEVGKAFSALDAVLALQPALIQAAIPESLTADVPPKNSLAQWSRLSSAGEQYARSLANARAQPLDPDPLSALCAAQRVLDDVWLSAARPESGTDTPDACLPQGLQLRLARLADQVAGPREAFDAAAMAYNTAVRQFPALILARIWGFKPAGLIGPQNRGSK
jgi:LemA protein